MELSLLHRLTLVEDFSEEYCINRESNWISFRNELGVSESYEFDDIVHYNLESEMPLCNFSNQESGQDSSLSYIIQGSTGLVRQQFADKVHKIACSELQIGEKEIGFQLKRIFSWGYTSLGTNSGIAEIHVLDEPVLSSLVQYIMEAFEQSCTDKSIVLFSLYHKNECLKCWEEKPKCCVMMLPCWKQSNKFLKQHIINFYNHVDERNNLLMKWLTTRVCIETFVHLKMDSMNEVLRWCQLGSKAVREDQYVVQSRNHDSEPNGSLNKISCLISEDESMGNHKKDVEEGYCLRGNQDLTDNLNLLRNKLLSEVTILQSEVKELQETKTLLCMSIEPLLSEIKSAKDYAKQQELSFLVQSQDLRHLLSAAYSSAAAEHKSILSQITDALDAILLNKRNDESS